MRMKCPHCGVSGRADTSLSGRKVKCPKCSRFFLIPAVEKAVEIVDTETEEALAPDLQDASVTGDEPAAGPRSEEVEPAAAGEEDPLGTDAQEQEEEPAGIDVETAVIGEYQVIAEDIELDDQPAEEPDEEQEDEITAADTGWEMEPEHHQDEQEYELDFPEEEDEGWEPQDTPEETAAPEMIEKAVEEGLDEESVDEDSPLEEMLEEQESDLSPAAVDTGKEQFAADGDDEFPDLSDEGVDWEEEQEPESGGESEEQEIDAGTDEEDLRAELEAMLAGTCSACGRTVDEEETFNEDGRIICSDCFNGKAKAAFAETTPEAEGDGAPELQLQETSKQKPGKKIPPFSYSGDFSVIRILKESWNMTRGLKGAVWGGIFIMMLILFGLGAAAVMLPSAGAPAGGTVTAWINILIQLASTILSMTFTAGLMYMGVRRVADRSFSWKMIFSGFARLGHVALAGILMTLLITSGFLLLVLPGIYLAVGYSLTLPLILDKGLGPWEAMEASRRCIHRKWWIVFGAYLLMYPIYFVSCIPFGLGMIWTIPMFIALSGVLYRLLIVERVE